MRQRGENKAYPEMIETFRLQTDKTPEWLTDRAKVIGVSPEGNFMLSILDLTSGGYEIKSSTGGILIVVPHQDDYVCFGDDRLFTLTPRQLEILYE